MRALVFYVFVLVLVLGFLSRWWSSRAPGVSEELREASRELRRSQRMVARPNGHHPPRPRPQASA